MSDAAPPATEQPLADLVTLHKQLEELATRTKRPSSAERERRQQVEGPVLIIRGK